MDRIRSELMHIILEALDDADSIRIIRPDMNALDSIQATVVRRTQCETLGSLHSI